MNRRSGKDDGRAGVMRRAVLLSVTCLGVSSIVTQIVTLREFLGVFAGNELVIGIILGNWLLLTGLGSYAGRYGDRIRDPIRWLLLCQTAIALAPPVQVALIRLLKALVLPGLMLGIGEIFLASLVLLSPYCLVSGFLLTLFSAVVSRRRDARQIGDVYVLDTVGDIAGGLIFSFFLVFFLSPFQTVTLLMMLNLAAATFLASSAAPVGRRLSRSLPLLGLLLLSTLALWRSDLESLTIGAGFPGQELLEHRTTAYGSLVVTRQGGQINVYENGLPVGSTEDPVAAEEAVHYALAQHPDPRTILLVSGGLTGAHRQAAKYPLERIDYVELDPAVLELAERLAGAGSDPRLRMIAKDARRLVRSSRDEYDAILMDLPDPATAQLNRFYTTEFFSEVHRALRVGGVFSFGLSGAENYANQSVRLLGSAVHRSLADVFRNVLVIPGARQFLIASDRPLDYGIAARLQERGIATDYVREDYLRGKLTEDRIAAARENLSIPTGPNRDFFPVSYYAHLRYWLSQFGSGLLLPSMLVVAILILTGSLLAGSRRPVVAGALCSSAFAGMGLEVVLLLAFQICYGYVYHQIGLIVTAFLIGVAAGAFWSNRRGANPSMLMLRLDGLLASAALLLSPVLLGLRGIESEFWRAWITG
jgi:spermidine synthase